jgi:uncharacterized protein YjbI with pentapeptide repeats
VLLRVLGALSLVLFISSFGRAGDLGYRYQTQSRKCVNAQGGEGLNPSDIGQCSDLRGVMISRLHLEGQDLSGSRFDGADLQNTTFRNANLTSVQFTGANLSGVDFSGAVVDHVVFREATLVNAQFAGVIFQDTDFSMTDLSGAQLSYLVFRGVKFGGAKLAGAALDYADLTSADLSGVDLRGANLQNAILSKAKFTGTDLQGADLSGADISKAQGDRATFINALLRGTNMSDARLRGTKFKRAQLEGANLSGADLTGSDLRGASLGEAKLEGTVLDQAVANGGTLLPISKAEAQQRGILFKPYGKLLIIWHRYGTYDVNNLDPEIISLMNFLKGQGVDVTLSSSPHQKFTGEELQQDYESVLHLLGEAYVTNMPRKGEESLLRFVKEGGTYIGTAWTGYMLRLGHFTQTMEDLVLIFHEGYNFDHRVFAIEEGQADHPIFQGLKLPIELDVSYVQGSARIFNENPVTVLARDANGTPMLALRSLGLGKVINFGFPSHHKGHITFTQEPAQRLVLNSLGL